MGEAYSNDEHGDLQPAKLHKTTSRGRAWEGHLARLRVGNCVAVVVFGVSMYRFMSVWDGVLNRMNFFRLAVPGFFVFASMTYLFGFFGIYIISGLLEPGHSSDGSGPSSSPTSPSKAKGNSPSSTTCRSSTATPDAAAAAASSRRSSYSLQHPEVVVVGAGTAGASMAVALARQGRKVLLLERSLQEHDRIVGELLQPGGVRALERMGLDACAKEGIGSIRVDGYAILKPADDNNRSSDDAAAGADGQYTRNVMLSYPENDPEGVSQLFGMGVVPSALGEEGAAGGAGGGVPRGRSFHNCRFVTRLREACMAEPNVRVLEATVTKLVQEEGVVVGVEYKEEVTVAAAAAAKEASKAGGKEHQGETAEAEAVKVKRVVANEAGKAGEERQGAVAEAEPEVEKVKVKQVVRAPLVVVADGIWSGLRKTGGNAAKPEHISSFVGVLVEHPAMRAPVPYRNCGHVVLAHPSPVLIYQISPTETRVLVDVMGPLPSAASGELVEHLRRRTAPQLPECFRPAFLRALDHGQIKSMPNRALVSPPVKEQRAGVVLVGDALNMRHPLTGGGMTVAIKDVELLSHLLRDTDCADHGAVAAAVKRFHAGRKHHATTINVLANALYHVFSTPEGSSVETRRQLQDACFEYLSLGGCYSAGPVGLLSGLSPTPWVLITHFFMVACYGAKKHLLPLPTPQGLLRMHRIMRVACAIIFPLVRDEHPRLPLAWWPVRKLAALVFPWEESS